MSFEQQNHGRRDWVPTVRRRIPVCGIVTDDIFFAGDQLHQVLEIREDERYRCFEMRVLSEKRETDWPVGNQIGRWICLNDRDTLEVFVGARSVKRSSKN